MANKMNIILLITVTFTPALVHGKNRTKPCMKGNDTGFIKKHIVQEDPVKWDEAQWKNYLEKNELCGRLNPLPQSFIYATVDKVQQICSKQGLYVFNNLCISKSKMTVYDVESKEDCTVQKVTPDERQVIVGCDKVGNECIPVHYQAKVNAEQKGGPCTK